MATDEAIIAIALGLPAFIVSVIALWIAFLTLRQAQLVPAHIRHRGPGRIPWPLRMVPALAPPDHYELPA